MDRTDEPFGTVFSDRVGQGRATTTGGRTERKLIQPTDLSSYGRPSAEEKQSSAELETGTGVSFLHPEQQTTPAADEVFSVPPIFVTVGEKTRNRRNFYPFLFFLGLGYGALLSGRMPQLEAAGLSFITGGFLTERAELTFWPAFCATFFSSFLLLAILFLSGFSAIGQPVSLFVLLFRGIGMGTVLGYFYLTYGLIGVLLSLLLILPQGILEVFALLNGCRASVRLSGQFFRILTRKEETLPLGTLQNYLIRFLLLTVICALAAGISLLIGQLPINDWINKL